MLQSKASGRQTKEINLWVDPEKRRACILWALHGLKAQVEWDVNNLAPCVWSLTRLDYNESILVSFLL